MKIGNALQFIGLCIMILLLLLAGMQEFLVNFKGRTHPFAMAAYSEIDNASLDTYASIPIEKEAYAVLDIDAYRMLNRSRRVHIKESNSSDQVHTPELYYNNSQDFLSNLQGKYPSLLKSFEVSLRSIEEKESNYAHDKESLLTKEEKMLTFIDAPADSEIIAAIFLIMKPISSEEKLQYSENSVKVEDVLRELRSFAEKPLFYTDIFQDHFVKKLFTEYDANAETLQISSNWPSVSSSIGLYKFLYSYKINRLQFIRNQLYRPIFTEAACKDLLEGYTGSTAKEKEEYIVNRPEIYLSSILDARYKKATVFKLVDALVHYVEETRDLLDFLYEDDADVDKIESIKQLRRVLRKSISAFESAIKFNPYDIRNSDVTKIDSYLDSAISIYFTALHMPAKRLNYIHEHLMSYLNSFDSIEFNKSVLDRKYPKNVELINCFYMWRMVMTHQQRVVRDARNSLKYSIERHKYWNINTIYHVPVSRTEYKDSLIKVSHAMHSKLLSYRRSLKDSKYNTIDEPYYN